MLKASFKGIVCVGKNHSQAVDNFRNTALGKNVMFFSAKNGNVVASQSGADLYSPDGSLELLSERPDLVEKANFASVSASTSDIRAEYSICLDGCGSHVVSESGVGLTNCPSCNADLSEITDERIHDFLATSMDTQSVSHSGVVAFGPTAAKAQQNYANALTGKSVFVAESSATEFKLAQAAKFDPYSGLSISSVKKATPEVFAALSSSLVNGAQTVEAHMYSCSASCENPFTVSSDENPVFCAHCSAVLIDMASESGDYDDEDMDDEDEDDSGAGIDILDDEDGDDEDFDSASSSDDSDDDLEEEDEEEEEDDIDDLDLDEDEEEEEDDIDDLLDDEDEEDDEEEDDIDSTSSASDDSDEDDSDDEDGDDADFIDGDDLDELESSDDSLDEDEDLESESNSKVVSTTFNSMSTVIAQNGTLNPSAVSLSRTVVGSVPTVHMFYNGVPFASATFASASAAIGEEIARQQFESDNFIRGVKADIVQSGVVAACSNFGFKPFTIEMPVDRMLRDEADVRISQATSDVQQTINESVDNYRERFIAALSTAMLGVTKGFWQNAKNPVVESLCSALSSAGVRDARSVVERAFFSHSADFLTVAMSQANSLMSKSEVAQNEIAEAVSSSVGISRSTEAAPAQEIAAARKETVSPKDLLGNAASSDPVQSQSSASDDFAARARSALHFN